MGKTLGVMNRHVRHLQKFDPYYTVALEAGFDDVVLFTPQDVDLSTFSVHGFVKRRGKWIRKRVPFPHVTHDIGYYESPRTVSLVSRIKSHKKLVFTGYGLGNKWKIQRLLSRHPALSARLIPTKVMKSGQDLLKMLAKYSTVMVKPINGKEGKGIIRVSRTDGGYLVKQNGHPDRVLTSQALKRECSRWKSNTSYIIQRWIDIRNREGTVFDLRALMQKNGRGEWKIAGMAVREGQKRSITSNLMDGGTPFEAFPYLEREFGTQQAEKLYKDLRSVAYQTAAWLEKATGRRQAELGIDLAVDRNGKIWIIEVNIKPGKIPFRSVFDLKTPEQQIRNPVFYAAYLAGLSVSQEKGTSG